MDPLLSPCDTQPEVSAERPHAALPFCTSHRAVQTPYLPSQEMQESLRSSCGGEKPPVSQKPEPRLQHLHQECLVTLVSPVCVLITMQGMVYLSMLHSTGTHLFCCRCPSSRSLSSLLTSFPVSDLTTLVHPLLCAIRSGLCSIVSL